MDDVPEHAGDLLPRRPLARPQQRQDRLARVGLEDVHRPEAVPARMRVEQGKLLAAVGHAVGIVDVEYDGGSRCRIATAEQVDEADADPIERFDVGDILEPRDGRLARNIVPAIRVHGCRRSTARAHGAARRDRRRPRGRP